LPEKIREQYGIQGYWYHGIVWSCEKCTWIHRADVAQFIQDNKSKFPGQVFTEALEKFCEVRR
jgi:Zn-finger protein